MTNNTSISSPVSSNTIAFLEAFDSSLSAIEIHQNPGNVSQPFSSRELPVTIFLAYVSEDSRFKDRIERVLSTLKRQGSPIEWVSYDGNRAIELFTDIEKPFEAYQLFLFLLSQGFVDHPLCYEPGVKKLIKRHPQGVWVLPILINTCLWEDTPFGFKNKKLPVLPNPQLPVTKWRDRYDADKAIAQGIKWAVECLKGGRI